MNEWTDYVTYKTTTLEKLQIGLELKIAREMVHEKDHYIGYRIRGYVWSQDAGRVVTFKYPADWWQAFKERWFSKWLLERYPVNYTHKEFRVKATYPDLVVQSHSPVMRLMEATYTSPLTPPPPADVPATG
jgi:hypothetical protein